MLKILGYITSLHKNSIQLKKSIRSEWKHFRRRYSQPNPVLVPEFEAHYADHIMPHVDEFEAKRLKSLGAFKTRMGLAVLITAILIGGGIGLITSYLNHLQPGDDSDGAGGIFQLVILLIMITWVWAGMPLFRYKGSIKEVIFPKIFSFYGDDYIYMHEPPLSVASLKPSELIPSYDNSHTEDYVKGTYKGVDLELMEARLTETRGSGKNRRTVTVFRGMFVRFSIQKPFAGQTIIKRDYGKLLNWLNDKVTNMEQVALEDPEFEKRFEVYSTDQVEARFLLTTSFMQRLLDMSELFGGKGIQASFYDNQLLIMIPSKEDRFEPGSIFAPATFIHDINTIVEEMRLIFDMVDILKLDTYVGL